jgi:hypothetical protein
VCYNTSQSLGRRYASERFNVLTEYNMKETPHTKGCQNSLKRQYNSKEKSGIKSTTCTILANEHTMAQVQHNTTQLSKLRRTKY